MSQVFFRKELVKIKQDKRLVVVSHCVLNQNAVVKGWQRAAGAFPFVRYLLEEGVSLLQLPCPELLELGSDRPPLEYSDYAKIPNYRSKCQQLIEPTLDQIRCYQNSEAKYLGVIGINDSPNCSISGQRGVLMEEFFTASEKNHFSTAYIEVPVWYSTENQGDFLAAVKEFIR